MAVIKDYDIHVEANCTVWSTFKLVFGKKLIVSVYDLKYRAWQCWRQGSGQNATFYEDGSKSYEVSISSPFRSRRFGGRNSTFP